MYSSHNLCRNTEVKPYRYLGGYGKKLLSAWVKILDDTGDSRASNMVEVDGRNCSNEKRPDFYTDSPPFLTSVWKTYRGHSNRLRVSKDDFQCTIYAVVVISPPPLSTFVICQSFPACNSIASLDFVRVT